jgi:DNA-binding MarR family transcriptional regulator
MRDAVDEMMDQWRRARPELDPSPMGIIGRVSRLNALFTRELKDFFGRYGLENWEFDVLATLRRAGDPDQSYELTAGALLKSAMVTSGAITNRIDRLERKGLVARRADPVDRRSVRIGLTEQGLTLIDEMIAGHLANERRILAALEDPGTLAGELRALLLALGDTTPG